MHISNCYIKWLFSKSIQNRECGLPKAQQLSKLNIKHLNKMSKVKNHQADIKNPNKGTPRTNTTYDKNQGNKGKQLNPNQQQQVLKGKEN